MLTQHAPRTRRGSELNIFSIAVAGMVGVGKSTLARALAAPLGMQLALEAASEGDNPWLPLFYGDGAEHSKRRYGLALQLHFLATRFRAVREMHERGGRWILDRTWYEDAEVFARGLADDGYMTALEHDLYTRLYAELLHSPAARPPRLLVYLDAPLAVVLARIRQRGRDKERDTPAEYWARLHARYACWIAGYRHSPVLTLDARDYDLLADPDTLGEIVARVAERLGAEVE
jgi:deoxyadenosine/deoxycytidine kinase